jgi:hypothetical protein
MSLYMKLYGIAERYKSDILIIGDFISSTGETLDLARLLAKHQRAFTNEDRASLHALIDAMTEATTATDKKRKQDWHKSIKTTAGANEIIVDFVKAFKNQEFFAEMALVYIISFQEGFIKDYLEELLASRIELLRSSKSLSYEEALRFNSITSLKRHLAEKETDTIGYGSIDDLNVYLIIHNRGTVNEIYRSKLNMAHQVRLSSEDPTSGGCSASLERDIAPATFVAFVTCRRGGRIGPGFGGRADAAGSTRPGKHPSPRRRSRRPMLRLQQRSRQHGHA